MGRCTRTSAAITSIAVPPTSRSNVWSNVWPTLATSWRSSRSPPEPCLRHHQQEEFAATSEPVSFFLARLSFAPPTCRMPLGQSQDIPQANPGRRVNPRFWHRLSRFRHFCSGSLALASLNRTCRNLVPTFPQRSPPRLLTTAACGGLRSTPDCRPRRTYLHLSYSYASPCGPALLVTQDPNLPPSLILLLYWHSGSPCPTCR